jgi:hypothetical protein
MQAQLLQTDRQAGKPHRPLSWKDAQKKRKRALP